MGLRKLSRFLYCQTYFTIITCVVYLQDRIEHVMYRRPRSSETVLMELLSGIGLPRKHTGDCRIKSYLVFYFRRPNNNRQPYTLQPVWRADGGGTWKYTFTGTHMPLCQGVLNHSIMIGNTSAVAYVNFIQNHLLNRC